MLAFLSLLPNREEQLEVLRRRLEFLEQPESFFYDGDRPLFQKDIADEYREGIFVIAKAASTAERRWLKQQLGKRAQKG